MATYIGLQFFRGHSLVLFMLVYAFWYMIKLPAATCTVHGLG